MANIQTTLDSLQPYVIGIRYVKNTPVVDLVLNDGWTLIDDPKIKRLKGDETINYYMIFSETNGVGLDDLLAYVEKIINANKDREKKHELLKTKVEELKVVFRKTPLAKLQKLKFSFGEEDFTTDITELDEPKQINKTVTNTEKPPVEIPEEEEIVEEMTPTIPNTNPEDQEETRPDTFLDENKQPIQLSEEDLEILEEEKRAKRNRDLIEAKKAANPKPIQKKVELPPRRTNEEVSSNIAPDCECGPEEACSKCLHTKDF